MKNILFVIGTRPEGIKLAPVILEAKTREEINVFVCSTGQHSTMLQSALANFDIVPDINLELMVDNQTLTTITTKIIERIDQVIHDIKPEWVVVQGDTATVFATSIATYYNQIKLAHVEAGLRTGDLYSPFPEEMSRRFCDLVSNIYFAPTKDNKHNLLLEGVRAEHVHVTGNTVIDALLYTARKQDSLDCNELISTIRKLGYNNIDRGRKFVLVTGHRRENFGDGIQEICLAIRQLSDTYKHFDFVYAVHLNPNIKEPVNKILTGIPNIFLLPPLGYMEIVYMMRNAYCIITDSGGIQEEAPTFKKPLIVTRNKTERAELEGQPGFSLAGNNQKGIVDECATWLDLDETTYQDALSNISNPFGDGTASKKIIDILINEI